MKPYITKDSGRRQEYCSGMVRDVQENKPRYDLCYEPLLTEWANLMARGAEKYGDPEEWQEHPELKGIEVSTFGNVRKKETKHIYATWHNKWGYGLVSLSGFKRRHFQVHKLVMETFVGESKTLEVNHKDFDRSNNQLSNLEYVTKQQNIDLSKGAGHYLGQQTGKNVKITYEIAEEIRTRVISGVKQKEVAKEYGISPQTVCDIMKRRIWTKNVMQQKEWNEKNWQLANSREELTRFKASAFRHFMQFLRGEDDEAHHAAICFNVGAIMYLRNKGVKDE